MAKKEKELQQLIDSIVKAHGEGSIIVGDAIVKNITVIPSGSIALDMALGVGGYPRGRITEVFGPESSGKTTLALHAVANAQKEGGRAAYIDAEHAVDIEYAAALGVDTSTLIFSQPDSGEQALQIAEKLIASNIIDVVVIDSVAALVPQAELDGEIGDSVMGAQARLMSQAMRKLSGLIKHANCVVIFINQIREKIGGPRGAPTETTSGGRALRFYASIRVDIRRTGSIGVAGSQTANSIKAKIVKNKVAPPFRLALFEIRFGTGIDNLAAIMEFGIELGIIDKKGGWFSYGQEKIGNGREKAIEWLKLNPDVITKIELLTRQKKLSARVAVEDNTEDLIAGKELEEIDGNADIQD